MKKLLALALLFLATPAVADSNITAKYGTAATIYFELRDAEESTPGLILEASATCATGDVKLIKDGLASANSTSCFTSETLGIYSLALTATEMQAKVISIVVDDATATEVWLNKVINIYTYQEGASGFHDSTSTTGGGAAAATGITIGVGQ